MNYPFSNTTRPLKNSGAIIAFAVIATVLSAIGSLSCVARFAIDINSFRYVLKFDYINPLSLLGVLLCIVPCILFLVYLLGFYKKSKGTVLLPVMFGVIAASKFFSLITNVMNVFSLENAGFNFITLISWVITLVTAILYIVIALDSTKAFKNKAFIIVVAVIAILSFFISLTSFFSSYDMNARYGILPLLLLNMCQILGFALLNVALLIFVFCNKVPLLVGPSMQHTMLVMNTLSPEQSLQLLKDKYELGIITEEEYQAQRAEIIEKL